MQVNNKELKANMEKLLGKKVLLLEPHPSAYQQGKTIRVDKVKNNGMKKLALIVKLDNGDEVAVFKSEHIFFILFQETLSKQP